MTDNSSLTFATFWAGKRLSAFECACLHSFAVRGYRTFLYSFEAVENVPDGVALLDASTIAPPDSVHRFRYEGKANLSHFSDYFRYLMFRKTEHIWIDADMLLLRPLELPLKSTVLARERADSICGAIMRLDSGKPELERLIRETEAAMDRELHWGETGPRLMTRVFGQDAIFGEAFAPNLFFPLTHDDFWKALLPEFRKECERLCGEAYTLHLWNNIVDRLGVWKMLAPPEGSFLARRFEQDGSLPFFTDTYPEKVMRQMVENWRLRKDGSDLGIAGLSRQVLPSMVRTLRHYAGDSKMRVLLGGKRAPA